MIIRIRNKFSVLIKWKIKTSHGSKKIHQSKTMGSSFILDVRVKMKLPLRKKQYRKKYPSVFSPNAGKYGPE